MSFAIRFTAMITMFGMAVAVIAVSALALLPHAGTNPAYGILASSMNSIAPGDLTWG